MCMNDYSFSCRSFLYSLSLILLAVDIVAHIVLIPAGKQPNRKTIQRTRKKQRNKKNLYKHAVHVARSLVSSSLY